MAIFGFGAYYDRDVTDDFVENNIIGIGWKKKAAPELHQLVRSLQVGDIVYIKSFPRRSPFVHVKAIGVIADAEIRTAKDTRNLIQVGRNIHWLSTEKFRITKPQEKNNVRRNSIYEEFHPKVQTAILRTLSRISRR